MLGFLKKKQFRYSCLIIYIFLSVLLIVESFISGPSSSQQSNFVGGTLADIFNQMGGDQTVAVHPTSFSIVNRISEAYVGDIYTIETETLPKNATYISVDYYSEDTEIAKVSADGKISFLKAGEVSITARNSKFISLKDTMKIRVYNVEAARIESEIAGLAPDEDGIYTVFQGNTYSVNTKFYPENTTFRELTYEINSEEYLQTDASGVLTALKYSKDQITELTVKHKELAAIIKIKVGIKNLIPVSEFITPSDFSVHVGETKSASVSAYPETATFQDYVLSCPDRGVTVSGNKITGVKEGNSLIYVTSPYHADIRQSFSVEVLARPPLSSLELAFPDYLTVGDTKPLKLKHTVPSYSDLTTLKYETYDSSVLSVSQKGDISAIKEGNATVRAYSNDILLSSIEIEVHPKEDAITKEFDISVSEPYLKIGDSYPLSSLFSVSSWEPYTPDKQNLIFFYEDREISDDFIPKATGTSSFHIVHTPSGISKDVSVPVIQEFEIVNTDADSIENISLKVGETFDIFIHTKDNTKQSYQFAFSDPEAATIKKQSNFYRITALKAENVTLTVFPSGLQKVYHRELSVNIDENLSETIEVGIRNLQTGESIEIEGPIRVFRDREVQLYALLDDQVSKSHVTYRSSEENIISVKEDGTLLFNNIGKAEITVSEQYSGLAKKIEITSINRIAISSDAPFSLTGDKIEYSKEDDTYSMTNGFSGRLKINFSSNSTYTAVSYLSSDSSVAEVSEDGTITPQKAGRTTIRMTVDDGVLPALSFEVGIRVKQQDLIRDLPSFFLKVRKGIGHFGSFLILGIFSTFTWLLFFDEKKWFLTIPVNLFLGFLLACITEFIQVFIPGRVGLFSDVMIDLTGFLISSVTLTLLFIAGFILRKRTKKAPDTDASKD